MTDQTKQALAEGAAYKRWAMAWEDAVQEIASEIAAEMDSTDAVEAHKILQARAATLMTLSSRATQLFKSADR